MYQRMKNRIEMLVRKLKLTKIPEKPWTHLTVEFITKLLLVARGDVILVVCGRFCGNNKRNISRRVGMVI